MRAVFLKSLKHVCNPSSYNPISAPSTLLTRTVASSSSSSSSSSHVKKPLHLVFQEAVGLREIAPNCEGAAEGNELQKKLLLLEKEVRDLKQKEDPNAKTAGSRGVKKYRNGSRGTSEKGVETERMEFDQELSVEMEERSVKQSDDGNAEKGTEEAKKFTNTLYNLFSNKGRKEVQTSRMGFKELAQAMELRHVKKSEKENGKKDAKEAKKSPNTLYSAFTGLTVKEEEEEEVVVEEEETKKEGVERKRKVFKELSPDMEMFVTHLYKEGYFSKANFLKPEGKLDFSCLNDSYSRDFIVYAAEKFADDHQEIAKWLSGSNLKKVALFGCPSLARKPLFAAKKLRKFFEIKEDTICSKCVLKHSCKFVNQSVWRGDTKVLSLGGVMRVIILYAMEDVHPDLPVPVEITDSVNQLLGEVLKLSGKL